MNPLENQTHKAPCCIGVIMDGNRRWARAHGMVSLEGHATGYEKMKEFLGWAREAGVSYVIIYAFSSENWNRSPEEVSYLMKLLRRAFVKGFSFLKSARRNSFIRYET